MTYPTTIRHSLVCNRRNGFAAVNLWNFGRTAAIFRRPEILLAQPAQRAFARGYPSEAAKSGYAYETFATLKQARAYSLRHYYASKLIEKDRNLKFIQQTMGYAQIEMTLNIYGHLMKDRDDAYKETVEDIAADLMPGLWQGCGEFERRCFLFFATAMRSSKQSMSKHANPRILSYGKPAVNCQTVKQGF